MKNSTLFLVAALVAISADIPANKGSGNDTSVVSNKQNLISTLSYLMETGVFLESNRFDFGKDLSLSNNSICREIVKDGRSGLLTVCVGPA